MLKVILGVLSFAVIVFFASQSFASANTDVDWAINVDVYEATLNLDNLDGYEIEYWAGECVLRLGHSFTHSVDTITVRVANAIPSYDILYYPAKITSCVTRD